MERAELEADLEQKLKEHAQATANMNAIWGVVQYLTAKIDALSVETRIVVPGPGDRIPTDTELMKTRG